MTVVCCAITYETMNLIQQADHRKLMHAFDVSENSYLGMDEMLYIVSTFTVVYQM